MEAQIKGAVIYWKKIPFENTSPPYFFQMCSLMRTNKNDGHCVFPSDSWDLTWTQSVISPFC